MSTAIAQFFRRLFLSQNERFFIFAVTIGSILEWHEIFLFVYWEPIVLERTFSLALPLASLIYTILLVCTAWIARPMGGILFGYIGDRWGRKTAFILSIVLVALPSFLISLVPSILTWGIFTITFYGLMKFFQGIPAGGETPGAICYFSENAAETRRTYICSYVFLGSQLGQITSMIECLLLQKYFSRAELLDWGLKISFLIGGLLGVIGFVFRRKLQESRNYEDLKKRNNVLQNPVKTAFTYHWKEMLIASGLALFEVVGFVTIAIFPVLELSKIFEISETKNIWINVGLLSLATLLLPVVGAAFSRFHQGEAKQKMIKLLRVSALFVILLAFPLYFALTEKLFILSIATYLLLIIFLVVPFALLPSLLSELFPTAVRFTCIGFSFNICDSIAIGITPIIIHHLTQWARNPADFILLLPITGLIFLIALRFFRAQSHA